MDQRPLISRDQAIEHGATRYFTGFPCLRGHIAERSTKNKTCLECVRLRKMEHRAKNVEEYRRRDRVRDKTRDRKGSTKPVHLLTDEQKVRRRTVARENARKRRMDPTVAMAHRVGSAIRCAVRRVGFTKRSKTAEILGCTWPEFKAHIEKQFLPGMTWENRELWHLDHITPLATAATEADVLALNHFTNLRPLWMPDNLQKGDKQLFLI